MPAKMSMFLSNGRPSVHQIRAFNVNNASLASSSKGKAPTILNAPMISRIHNIQPGCGSCGRH
jgi:hypothetical protein